jgi:hypothetical protein
MRVKVSMSNSGHLAATNIQLRIDVSAFALFDSPFEVPQTARSKLCGEPDQGFLLPKSLLSDFPQSEIRELTFETRDIANSVPEYKRKPIWLFVYGCVAYDYSPSPVRHQTPFIYQVVGSHTSYQGIQVGIDVTAQNLSFRSFQLKDFR